LAFINAPYKKQIANLICLTFRAGAIIAPMAIVYSVDLSKPNGKKLPLWWIFSRKDVPSIRHINQVSTR
jgi:hypothetical protein